MRDVGAAPKGIAAQAVEAVTTPLEGLGFRRRLAYGLFTIELAPDLLGWLGLNRASQHYAGMAVELFAVVGVRHQGVERLVAELRGEKFHRYIPATVGGPLRNLLPAARRSTWIFEAGARLDETAADMTEAVERFGLPALRSISGLAELRRKIEEGWGFSHQLVYRLPVVCWLDGDEAGANDAIDAALAEVGERQDPAADEFRAFARAFRLKVARDR